MIPKEFHAGDVEVVDPLKDAGKPRVVAVSLDAKLAGVRGINRSVGAGVVGTSDSGGPGVIGIGADGDGVVGSGAHNGVVGRSNAPDHSGVWADNSGGGRGVAGTSDGPGGVGVFGRGARLAGLFEGDVEVTGDIRLVNADCAEEFALAGAADVDPGTVMVITNQGLLDESCASYDRRVAGIVSGAGLYRPALILDRQDSRGRRVPIALLGKVFCKVDADPAPIAAGDVLTTSDTPGYAMKARDPERAAGALVGKALSSLEAGRGLIPVLVALG